jgi:phosphoglycolate phosphatase
MPSEKRSTPYKALIFDLDGTLLDSLEDVGNAMNRVLASRGFPTHELEAYRYFIGDGTLMLITRALPDRNRNNETIRTCIEAFREDYGRTWKVKTKPYDGVAEMLDALVARGVKMAVLSNKADDFTRLSVRELLSHWTFDVVLGQRKGIPPKPDPTSALEVSHLLNVAPRDFLYLGDSAVDMKTAIASGMFGVGALWGFRSAAELRENGARILIQHPAEILDLLE